MSTPYQVVIDCADPHRLAEFWAAAMDLRVEDHEERIRGLAEEGLVTSDDYTERDGRLVWRGFAACRGEDRGTRLLFQVVPEPKQGKNRVHLDLFVGDERRESEVERLTGLGARRLWDGSQGPYRWVTMADPEGNELCLS